MSLHRRAAKRDDSEPEIIEAFEKGGATVQRLSGEHVPDLLIGFRGRNRLVECKTGDHILSAGQMVWHDSWLGDKPLVIRNAAQARKAMTMWDRECARLSRLEAEDQDR